MIGTQLMYCIKANKNKAIYEARSEKKTKSGDIINAQHFDLSNFDFDGVDSTRTTNYRPAHEKIPELNSIHSLRMI